MKSKELYERLQEEKLQEEVAFFEMEDNYMDWKEWDEFKLKTMLSNDIYIEESIINDNKELLDTLKWSEFKKLLKQQDYKVKTQKNKIWIWLSNEEDRFFTTKTLKFSIIYSLVKRKVS